MDKICLFVPTKFKFALSFENIKKYSTIFLYLGPIYREINFGQIGF